MKIGYLNAISFEFSFEVVEFNNVLQTGFDVLLGEDILDNLNIGLTNVAYKYSESANHDPSNKYDPENADYGTSEESG